MKQFSTGDVEERIEKLNAGEAPDPGAPGPGAHPGGGDPAGDPAQDLPGFDPDLEEVKQLLLDGFMAAVGWIYQQRAREAGPHWNLSIEEAAAIERPADRVIEKWTPAIASWVPGFALKLKEEIVLVMVLVYITRKRVKIDQALAAEAMEAEASGKGEHDVHHSAEADKNG
jgi:hypothetical protein